MSVDLGETHGVHLNQFWGGTKRGMMVQLTIREEYVQLNPRALRDLAVALLKASNMEGERGFTAEEDPRTQS